MLSFNLHDLPAIVDQALTFRSVASVSDERFG